MGRSMGAAASLVYASENSGLSGLCLIACPADLPATFSGMLGADYERLEAGQSVSIQYQDQSIRLTPEFIHDLKQPNLFRSVGQLNGLPILIVHGLEDDTVAVEQGQRLYAAANSPKELILLPGVSHSFTGLAERFAPQVVQWLCRQVFSSNR